MDVLNILDAFQKAALENLEIRSRILATRQASDPLFAFCEVARALGYELYPMELIVAGEEFHAQMKRSTNGGGENSPKLEGEDDFYELFLAALE